MKTTLMTKMMAMPICNWVGKTISMTITPLNTARKTKTVTTKTMTMTTTSRRRR